MKPIQLILSTLTTLPLFADLSTNMERNVYEPAHKMMQMDATMNKAMDQHNQKERVVEVIDETDATFDDNPIAEIKDMGESYRLEQNISEPKKTTVEIKVDGDMLKISTLTINTVTINNLEHNTTNTSEERQSIPYDADKGSMSSSYIDGLLTVTFDKL